MSGEVRWRRVWPRRPGDPSAGLVLEGRDGRGGVVAGTADGPGHPVRVRTVDPGLPGLAGLPGVLVGHRYGKRAVLRREATFVKLASARATRTALDRHAALARALGRPGDPALVEVLAARDGVLELAAAEGHDLSSTLDSGDLTACERDGERTGAALAALATARTRDLPVHDAAAEVAVLERWVADAVAFGLAPPALAARAAEAASALGSAPDGCGEPLVPAHRDLHDGQVLLGERVTFLDVDTAALADPALDAANLLAHLDLAAARGRRREAAALERGVRRGLPDLDPARVAVLRRVARCRLVAVHAFRGLPPAVAGELLAA
ncbi:hypothetical protein [Kineococcus sp. SYSU DK003]|uniref:hypothetical protein n=1 Tax=Kineococcus sp. SYSU DK003 TaxID=3383124 RepID=UPI003D7D5040